MVIKTKNLGHKGGIYLYRTHEHKIHHLCTSYEQLRNFLAQSHQNCPDHYFSEGPRSSTLKISLNAQLPKERHDHEVCFLAAQGLQIHQERYKDNHSKVQVFMLEHDTKTIAMEVPLWMHAHELDHYEELFNTNKELTGHIDILRIEDGNIWIWDYKPNAHREKYAATQVWMYAKMLSQRTGIPMTNFRCGYFDDKVAYTFDPNTITIPQLAKLTTYTQ